MFFIYEKIILGVIIVLFLGILIPKFAIKDTYTLSQDDRDVVESITYNQFDNFIEKLIIVKVSIDNKKDETVYTSAYTLWGLKYATVELNFKHEGTITSKRWFKR